MSTDLVERVVASLEPEFSERVDGETLRAVVAARASRFADAPIQDYVPMLVAREVRRSLRLHT